jgi:hypothetical protein
VSSLWTPGGERPITSDAPAGSPTREPGEPTEEELRQAAEQYLAEIQNTPAQVIVANHAIQLFELARIYLSGQPPSFDDARLAIDAMTAVVESLGGRLGEDEATLTDALAQIRLAFVQMRKSLGEDDSI